MDPQVQSVCVLAKIYEINNMKRMRFKRPNSPSELPEIFKLQGPVEINKAHRDVEYILHCIAGVPYRSSREEYKATHPHLISATTETNSLGQIIVRCPNGKTYNLSCALRNANLDYFMLIPEAHENLLIALQKLLNPNEYNTTLRVGSKLTQKGDYYPIYRIEEEAIIDYSGEENFLDTNALLRGLRLEKTLSDEARKKMIATTLLAISGVNKNVSPVSEERKSTQLTRYINTQLPAGLASEMMKPFGLQRLSGFNSFSKRISGSPMHQNLRIKLIIQDNTGRRSIEKLSSFPLEEEVLHTSMHLSYSPQEGAKEDGEHFTVKADPIYGLATETTYEYVVELALSEAYENHLKKPYKDTNISQADLYERGINRPNHALAHHARVVSYTDAVVDYFQKFASDSEFKKFCENLSDDEIEKIKVLLAFSKTGRESEIGFLDNPEKFMSYQVASCINMAKFMKDQLSLKDDEIAFWSEIQKYTGDPNYSKKATGPEEEKRRKIYICHIATLAHKLDLPRCFDTEKYQKAVEYYQSSDIVAKDAVQKEGFKELERLASHAIIETSDDQFNRCNSDVFYCMDRCMFAQNLNQSTELEQKRLKGVSEFDRYVKVLEKRNYNLLKSATDFQKFCMTMNPSIEVMKEIFEKRAWEINSAADFQKICMTMNPPIEEVLEIFEKRKWEINGPSSAKAIFSISQLPLDKKMAALDRHLQTARYPSEFESITIPELPEMEKKELFERFEAFLLKFISLRSGNTYIGERVLPDFFDKDVPRWNFSEDQKSYIIAIQRGYELANKPPLEIFKTLTQDSPLSEKEKKLMVECCIRKILSCLTHSFYFYKDNFMKFLAQCPPEFPNEYKKIIMDAVVATSNLSIIEIFFKHPPTTSFTTKDLKYLWLQLDENTKAKLSADVSGLGERYSRPGDGDGDGDAQKKLISLSELIKQEEKQHAKNPLNFWSRPTHLEKLIFWSHSKKESPPEPAHSKKNSDEQEPEDKGKLNPK